MRKRSIISGFLSLALSCGGVGPVWADLNSDAQKSAEWFSQEVGDLMAFQASSTHFLPAGIVGFPGFEVGIAAGVSAMKLDVDGYRHISFSEIDEDEADLPATIAAPAGVLHAKVGLPWGLDLGFKAGSASFDSTDGEAKTEFKNKIFGLELRKRLLGGGLTGVAVPDLTLSVGLDKAKGDITRTETYNGPVTSGGTLVANNAWKTDWDVSALTLRAVVSKKLLIFTPYAGLGVTKMSGDTHTDATVDVTGGTSGLSDTSSRGSAEADDSVGHAILGLELSPLPFFRLNLGGLVAKEHWAASVGLRVQFP